VTRIHLAAGLAIRDDGAVLLVASRYPNHPEPLWNLPGGRQEPGELLSETVVREVLEETGMRATAGPLAYVGESYDGDVHVLCAVFHVRVEPGEAPAHESDHVAGFGWVARDELSQHIAVAVVRDPLLRYLDGTLAERYAGYHEAGVTIEWPEESP
jgi:ADP-ribose pyrophosphatase YjhB (NUDIX family)